MPSGLWGFASLKNRTVANTILEKIIPKPVQNKYPTYINLENSLADANKFIEEIFLNYVQKNVTIHDSFYCDSMGGVPFPSKRTFEYCFTGNYGCCHNLTENNYYSEISNINIQMCNKLCRPIGHENWIFC